MEITEVRIKLMEESGERLRAFCSITFDDAFVVRDMKIIEGVNGLFVAMPSRKLASRCPQCSCKNHLRAAYCNQCGVRLKDDRAAKDEHGRAKLYADIAHPINSRCREQIQQRITEAYYEEVEKSKQPGYVSRYDEFEAEFEETGLDYAASPGGIAPSEGIAAGPKSVPAGSEVTESRAQPPEEPQGPHAGTAPPQHTQSHVPRPHRAAGFGEGIL